MAWQKEVLDYTGQEQGFLERAKTLIDFTRVVVLADNQRDRWILIGGDDEITHREAEVIADALNKAGL